MTISSPQYLGDLALSSLVQLKFTTADSTGAPIVLAGTPAISMYKGSSLTQTTTGVSLTVSFDSVVGLNHVTIDTSDAFYTTATDFQVVITTGTVDGVSAVGYVVGSFSLNNRSALRPTVAARTLDVTATGEGGIDWANIGSPTTVVVLSGTTVGVATALSSTERDAIADAFLNRNMATGTDSGSPTVRTPRQALRAARNKVVIAATVMTVYKEDDTTSSWIASVTTDAAAIPVTGIDPA